MNKTKTGLMAVFAVMLMLATLAVALVPAGESEGVTDSGSPANYQDAKMWVLGNANGDTKINADDKSVITSKIGTPVADAPMCDANHDGSITADDVTFVESLIDGTAVYCYYYNVDGAICKFTFYDKINTIALHRCVVRSATILANFDTDVTIVGMDGAPYGEVEFNVSANYPGCVNVGVLKEISKENCATYYHDYQETLTDTGLVIMVGTIGYYLPNLEDWAVEYGFQVVRIPTWEHHPTEGLLTTAYLFAGCGNSSGPGDGDCWQHAQKYADWAFGILDKIKAKSTTIPEADRLKVLGVYTTTKNYEHANHTRGPGSGDYENFADAGGNNIATRFGPGSKADWTMENIASYCGDLDVLILMSTNCFSTNAFNVTEDMKELTEKMDGYVKKGCKVYAMSWALNGAPFTVQMVYYAKIFMPNDTALQAELPTMEQAWAKYLELIGWNSRTDISLDIQKVCSDVNAPGVTTMDPNSSGGGSINMTLVGGVAAAAVIIIAIIAFAFMRKK